VKDHAQKGNEGNREKVEPGKIGAVRKGESRPVKGKRGRRVAISLLITDDYACTKWRGNQTGEYQDSTRRGQRVVDQQKK